MSIVLCVFMLAGTTWAWFTDSVTNAGNKIQAGTLDVSLLAAKSDGAGGYGALTDVSGSTEPIFKGENWEPGYSTGVKLAVKNNGTLSLKYKLTFGNLSATKGIEEVLEVAVDGTPVGTLSEFVSGAAFLEGTLAGGETSAEKTVVVTMQTSAGNDYQGASATFDIRLVATQTAENAVYPPVEPIETELTGTVVANEETVLESGTTVKATIPANAAPAGTEVKLSVGTVTASEDSVVYDISLTDSQGQAVALNEKIRIELSVGRGLSGFSVKHNGIPMPAEDYSYDAATGVLTIETATFSPFEVYFVKDAAATVGNDSYATLDAALAAASAGEVIFLWKDAALTKDVTTGAQLSVPATASVALDLAGHKLTSTYAGISVANHGTLTIHDSVGTGILHNTSAEVGENYSHDAVRNYGNLTINGGTFGDEDSDRTNANTEHRGAALRNMEGAVCEINGGFFTCGDNYYTWGDGTGYSYAIRSSGELTINDATLYGAMNGGISADAGHITINGGDFSVTGATSYYVLVTNKSAGGTITVNGGAFTKTGGNGGLLGGFSGMPSWDAMEDLAANGFTITGGTFEQDGSVKTYRRVSTAEEFTTAVSAANADDVIVLAGKIGLTSQVTVSKPLAFVGLAGSGISGAPVKVAENVSASFRNIAFSSPKNANNNASCVYGSGLAKLVFEGCTFTDTQWDSIQFTPVAGGEIVIDGCTFTNSVEGYRFIHIEADFKSNAAVKVTITNNTFGSSAMTTMSIIDIDYIDFSGITAGGNTFADEQGDIYICGGSVDRTISSADAYEMFRAPLNGGEEELL